MLPLLHTSEEIRTLARDRSVSAELFSELKDDRFITAVADIPGSDELMHTVWEFGWRTLPRSAWFMTDSEKLVIQNHMLMSSSVICDSVMQACLSG